MKLTSSQRWAIGAIALAVLIACSPPSEDPPLPEPTGPTLSSADPAGLPRSP